MSSHKPQQSEGIVLLPESVSRRKLPLNVRESDLDLFRHEIEMLIPQTRLLELRNVRVSSDGFLFKGLKLLPLSFAFPANVRGWQRRSLLKFFAVNYLFRRRRTLMRPAIWALDDWSCGYFHWLADVLPRLLAIKERLPTLALLLPRQYRRLNFVAPSLAPFGVREVEFIGADEVLLCARLIVPTHTAPSGQYNEALIREVRRILVERYGDASDSVEGECVYISRGNAPKRRIANEEEIIGVLRAADFRIVRAEDYTFEQQVALFAQTRYLVSNHGAGLTNMLFMRSGGSLLELRHETDAVNNCYFTLASALNLNYFYQTCAPAHTGEDPHTADLIVEADRLRENLRLMLEG
jgi:capsular polysaccharide biosynthesis protein